MQAKLIALCLNDPIAFACKIATLGSQCPEFYGQLLCLTNTSEISRLSLDLLKHIFGFLKLAENLQLRYVCKEFSDAGMYMQHTASYSTLTAMIAAKRSIPKCWFASIQQSRQIHAIMKDTSIRNFLSRNPDVELNSSEYNNSLSKMAKLHLEGDEVGVAIWIHVPPDEWDKIYLVDVDRGVLDSDDDCNCSEWGLSSLEIKGLLGMDKKFILPSGLESLQCNGLLRSLHLETLQNLHTLTVSDVERTIAYSNGAAIMDPPVLFPQSITRLNFTSGRANARKIDFSYLRKLVDLNLDVRQVENCATLFPVSLLCLEIAPSVHMFEGFKQCINLRFLHGQYLYNTVNRFPYALNELVQEKDRLRNLELVVKYMDCKFVFDEQANLFKKKC